MEWRGLKKRSRKEEVEEGIGEEVVLSREKVVEWSRREYSHLE